MRLPNGDQAIVELAKLTDYRLSRTHARGKHKARIFELRLGLTSAEAATLRAALLVAAANSDAAVPGAIDGHGQRFVLDLQVQSFTGSAVVRSAWIVRTGETFPRFASCYVL